MGRFKALAIPLCVIVLIAAKIPKPTNPGAPGGRQPAGTRMTLLDPKSGELQIERRVTSLKTR